MENIDKIIYTNTKRITLLVDQSGAVVLKIPYKATDKAVERFVSSKQDWIIKHRQKILARNLAYNDLISYKKVSVLGRVFDLNYNAKYSKPALTEHELIVKDQKALIKYYKNLAKEVLTKRISDLSKIIDDLPVFESKIDNSKVKWGSCSSTRVIKINFRVVMLEHKLIDYVLVHELCHLKQMNHSPLFWGEVEKILPNYKILKKKLSEYDFLLGMYR